MIIGQTLAVKTSYTEFRPIIELGAKIHRTKFPSGDQPCHLLSLSAGIYNTGDMPTPYCTALKALIGIVHRLNIVVVGANDGKTNDPIYNFTMKQSRKTQVLLIEPNAALLPYLRESYSSHPCHQIANCAIGKDGVLTLYAIKEDWWSTFQPHYAKEWPVYRAATGITSATREHLEASIASHLDLDPEQAIHILCVPSNTLTTLLTRLNWPTPIDVFQIDTEGHDDSIIYASNLELTRPKLIYFECRHIPPRNVKPLLTYLSSHHYRLYEMDGDALAVDSRKNLSSVYINTIVVISLWLKSLSRWMRRTITAP